MIGRLSSVVLDSADPHRLAAFYSEMLGLPIISQDDDWVDIGESGGWQLSFQLAPDHQAPQWPDPDHPQQFHLDIAVDDIDEAELKVLALGAKLLDGEASSFRVYADPSGHPFCLCS